MRIESGRGSQWRRVTAGRADQRLRVAGARHAAGRRGRRGGDRRRPQRCRAALESATPSRSTDGRADEAVGRTLQDLAIAPEDARFAQKVMRKVSRGSTWTGDFPIRRRDGSARTVHGRIVPFYDEAGELTAMVGFSTDVTEDRLIEAERRRNEQELEYLARASAILDSSLELPVTLQQLAELAVPFIGDGCMVDVRREDGTIERFAMAAVDDELREGFERLHRHPIDPAGEHPIARAMRSGQAQLPEQIEREDRTPWATTPEHLEDLRRFPGRLGMVAPIKAGDRLLGTLSIALSPQQNRLRPRTTWPSSWSWRAAHRPRSRMRACTPSGRTSPRRCSRACCRRASRASTASTWRRSTARRWAAPRSAATSTTCSRPAGAAGVSRSQTSAARASRPRPSRPSRGTRCAPPRCTMPRPAEMLQTVNDALLNNFHGDQFCTVALGVVESNGRSARLTLDARGPSGAVHPARRRRASRRSERPARCSACCATRS